MKKRYFSLLFYFVGLVLFIPMLFLASCTKETKETTTTSTSADSFNPKGTLQGTLRDAVTNNPISGAIIDIGVAQTTTDEQGQYTLQNVPATTDAANGTVTGSYSVTIDLRSVNSNNTAGEPDYPDFVFFDSANVKFTSLDDPTVTVDQLVASKDFLAGKLDANITGLVSDESSGSPVPVTGATVNLHAVGADFDSGTDDTATGATRHLVGTTTTDANGNFSFANIEAFRDFVIEISANGGSLIGGYFLTAPADGQTISLVESQSPRNGNITIESLSELELVTIGPDPCDGSVAIVNCAPVRTVSIDAVSPSIVSVTPEPGSDQTAGTTSVVITFSEPIKQTVGTSTDPSGVDNLFDNIEVNFDGNKPVNKAGNAAYTLAWNTTFDQLTVTFTTGASSLYHVRLLNVDDGTFTDENDNKASLGVCPDDSAAPTDYGIAVDGDSNDCTIFFTTNGGATASAPAITITNKQSLDSSSTPILDWLPVSGAKSYNVYRQTNQVWGTTVNSGPFELVTNVLITEFAETEPLSFIENNQIKLTYSYIVRSISSDGVESAASNTETAEDKVGPILDTDAATFRADLNDGDDTLTLSFNEPLDEASAEAGTYTISVATGTAPTVSSAVYSPTTFEVILTLSGDLDPANLGKTSITTGANGISNTTANVNDTQSIPNGQGSPNATCITAGTDGSLNTSVLSGDDAITGTGSSAVVTSGADGICNTTALTTDVQSILVGQGQPNQIAINAGTDLFLNSTASGDDTIVMSVVVIVSGVKDVAGNTIRTTGDQQNTDGTVQ